MRTISEREFTEADQLEFAELSGDYNPVHIDKITARKLMFGEQIVHGIHVLMWALDKIVYSHPQLCNCESITIKTRFRKPVFLHELILLVETVNALKYTIMRHGVVLASIHIVQNEDSRTTPNNFEIIDLTNIMEHQKTPKTPSIQNAGNIQGLLGSIENSHQKIEANFSNLTISFGISTVAELALTSNVIGMQVPGMNSIFAAVQVTLKTNHTSNQNNTKTAIRYAVASANSEFNMVNVNIVGKGIYGVAEAFFRPPPNSPPSIEMLNTMMSSTMFSGHNVLVVGGSRGLGAIFARVLAVGGANVKITYAKGITESKELALHPNISYVHLDITDISQDAISSCFSSQIDTLIYCATPRIFFRRTKPLHVDYLQNFLDFYLAGFGHIFESFIKQAPKNSICINPSSIEVESKNTETIEYRVAKKSSEDFCQELRNANPECEILTPRLPRLETDQTLTITPIRSIATTPYIINLLKYSLKVNK